MVFSFSLSSFLKPSAPAPDSVTQLMDEAQQLHALKREALTRARAGAMDDAGNPRMPTLEDYRLAAVAIGSERGLDEAHWNPRVYANLDGQDITGFLLQDRQALLPGSSAAPQSLDFYDQDGDRAITDFYANVSFYEAKLKDCMVRPATSFNDALSHAAALESVTFCGMQEGDVFRFGGGAYANVTLEQVSGGNVVFGQGARVEGLVLSSGLTASVTMEERAHVQGITVGDGVRIIDLQMAPGASICNAVFGEHTISQVSCIERVRLEDVSFAGNISNVAMDGATHVRVVFDGANLSNTSMRGATLDRSQFKNGCLLDGLDLRDAVVIDLMLNGKPVTDLAQLANAGAHTEGAILQNSQAFLARAELTETLKQTQQWGGQTLNESGKDAEKREVLAAMSTPGQPERPVPAKKEADGPSLAYYYEKMRNGDV